MSEESVTKNRGINMKLALSLIAVMCLLAPAGITLAECKIKDYNLSSILGHISDSTSCEEAAEIARDCGYGSSLDIQIAGQATEKCNELTGELNTVKTVAYDTLSDGCYSKYAGKQGTMYVSFTAYCILDIAETFNKVYSTFED